MRAAGIVAAAAFALGCVEGALGEAGPAAPHPADAGTATVEAPPRDAGAGASGDPDAARPNDAGAAPDAGSADGARVPVFVAYGHAARTIVSCDGGETWVGEHAFEEDGHDHSAYSGIGRMVFGGGRFVACAGWGNPTRVLVSEDGFAWEDLPDAAFLREDGRVERPSQGCSGVAWDGAQYAFVAGDRVFTSDDARRWERRPERLPGADHVRGVGGGDGLLVAIRSAVPWLSEDGGASWTSPERWDLACGDRVQRGGGVVVQGDLVVIGGRDGPVCASHDRGRTFTSTAVTTSTRSIVWADGALLLTAGRGELFRSPDGLDWRRLDADLDQEIAALAFADGAYVAVARDAQRFFVSGDGLGWRPARSEGTDDDYLWVIVPGQARPSAACPGR